jgi:hypothetical protein
MQNMVKYGHMRGIALTFVKQIETGLDEMNNPVNSTVDVIVEDCLVAPISEPSNVREQQAMMQSRDQVRIHLPKAFEDDISDSDFVWGNKRFHVDSDSVVFMAGNTPTRWNRYFRAECVANYLSHGASALTNGFLSEDGQNYFASESSYYYFAQEMLG